MTTFQYPDFLIVGAMKAGTTTLSEYLHKNQEIAIPKQEVHYFSNESNYTKGLQWYAKQFPINENTKIIGEKTPAYSLHSHVPKRIYDLNPNVNLVWIFRNPVYRTYSNYLHAVRAGAEKNSFEKALKLEEQRNSDDYTHDYLKRSLYVNQIHKYLSYFPIENMHFIIFEEFVRKPFDTIEELCNFLGVEGNVSQLDKKEQIQSNKSYLPFSIILQYYSRKYFGNSKIHKAVNKLNTLFPRSKPSLKKETEKKLYDFFAEENIKLSNLINKDLSIWKV